MAEVPPFLWSDAGTFPSPKEYKVPGAGEVQPYTATATYVNASGQAILPALRIKSAEGALLSLTFPVGSTIADGASSEVTFVPPFGSAQGSAAPPVTSATAWAFMQRTSVLVSNFAATTTGVDFDLANNHVSGFTSDATILDVGVAVGGGLHGITLKAEGQYLWAASAVGTPAAAPAAGKTSAITTSWDNGDCWACNYVSPFLTGPGAAVTQTQPFIIEQFNLKAGGNAPPQSSTVFLSQNSGGNCTFGQVTFVVYYFSPVGTLDFT